MFVFFCIYSGVVFSIITFTLLSTLGNVGKALGIIYLIVQVAGSGGVHLFRSTRRYSDFAMLFPFLHAQHAQTIAGPLAGSVTGDVVGLFPFRLFILARGLPSQSSRFTGPSAIRAGLQTGPD